jgi:hypothetical protein
MLIQINDTYHWQPAVFAGRPTYKGAENSLDVYYLAGRSVWAIGLGVGSLMPCAYLEAHADRLELPHESLKGWRVFSRDRSEDTTRTDSLAVLDGVFEEDAGVACHLQELAESIERSLSSAELIKKLNEEMDLSNQRKEWRMTVGKKRSDQGIGAVATASETTSMTATPPILASTSATPTQFAVTTATTRKVAAARMAATPTGEKVAELPNASGVDNRPVVVPPRRSPSSPDSDSKTFKALLNLPKGQSLGCAIANRNGKNLVKGMKTGGICDTSSLLKVGDMFLKINETDVRGFSKDDFLKEFKKAMQPPTGAESAQLQLIMRRGKSVRLTLTIGEGQKIGLNIAHEESGNYVKAMEPGSASDASGLIRPGDRLVEINGTNTTHLSLEEAFIALKGAKTSGPRIRFVLLKEA